MKNIDKKAFRKSPTTVLKTVTVFVLLLFIALAIALYDSFGGGAVVLLSIGLFLAVALIVILPVLLVINRNRLTKSDFWLIKSNPLLKHAAFHAVKKWLFMFALLIALILAGIVLLVINS